MYVCFLRKSAKYKCNIIFRINRCLLTRIYVVEMIFMVYEHESYKPHFVINVTLPRYYKICHFRYYLISIS